MRMNTRELSRHSTKNSKQSSSITLSLTNALLKKANDYLTLNSLSSQESFHELRNKRAIVR